MTVTKRNLIGALNRMDDNDVIYIDNGIDSMECRAVTLVEYGHTGTVSSKEDGTGVEAGSLVLRLAN